MFSKTKPAPSSCPQKRCSLQAQLIAGSSPSSAPPLSSRGTDDIPCPANTLGFTWRSLPQRHTRAHLFHLSQLDPRAPLVLFVLPCPWDCIYPMPRTSVSGKGRCRHHYSTIFALCRARAELCSTGACKPEVYPIDTHTKYNCHKKKKNQSLTGF